MTGDLDGWSAADAEREDRRYTGQLDHWDDDEPFTRPAPPSEPLPAAPAPVGEPCQRLPHRRYRYDRWGSRCPGRVVDGKCTVCKGVPL